MHVAVPATAPSDSGAGCIVRMNTAAVRLRLSRRKARLMAQQLVQGDTTFLDTAAVAFKEFAVCSRGR